MNLTRFSDGGIRLTHEGSDGLHSFREVRTKFVDSDRRPINLSVEGVVAHERYICAGMNLTVEEAGEVIASLARMIQEATSGT